MYEKILQKLKLQRGTTSNVSDRSLEDLAKALETLIIDDASLEKADLTNAIKSIDGNISNYTAEAVKNIKKEEPVKNTDPVKAPEQKKEEPQNEELKTLMDAVKQLSEKLGAIEGEKATLTRKEKLSEKLKETPTLFKAAVLKSFERQTFKDDQDFDNYLVEIEEQSKTAIQEGKEKGLAFGSPGANVHKPDSEGVSPEMEKTIKEMTEVKEIKKPF